MQVKFDVLWNLVIWLSVFDSLDVESDKSVGRKVLSNELGQVEEALLQICNRVSGDGRHLFIIPDAQVHLFQSCFVLLEKSRLHVFLLLFLENVDRQKHRACSNLTRSVVEEYCFVQLELANLKSHVIDCSVEIIAKNSKVSLHCLNWSWEVEVESEHDKDLRLQIDQRLLGYCLLFVLCQKVDHSGKRWRNRLLKFCGHQNRDRCQMDRQVLWEVGRTNDVDVSVEDASSNEQRFLFVVFLCVQIEDFLNAV